MDGAWHTITQLEVQFGQGVALVHRGIADVSDGSSLYDVYDNEPLDCLIKQFFNQIGSDDLLPSINLLEMTVI